MVNLPYTHVPADFDAALQSAAERDETLRHPAGMELRMHLTDLVAAAYGSTSKLRLNTALNYTDAVDDCEPSRDSGWPEATAEDLCEQLALDRCRSRDELLTRRREFARRFHPDLFPSDRRRYAESMMKLINVAIDQRLKQLPDRSAG